MELILILLFIAVIGFVVHEIVTPLGNKVWGHRNRSLLTKPKTTDQLIKEAQERAKK